MLNTQKWGETNAKPRNKKTADANTKHKQLAKAKQKNLQEWLSTKNYQS